MATLSNLQHFHPHQVPKVATNTLQQTEHPLDVKFDQVVKLASQGTLYDH